jgi:hypothetical protein
MNNKTFSTGNNETTDVKDDLPQQKKIRSIHSQGKAKNDA